jgi:hypothetical protein
MGRTPRSNANSQEGWRVSSSITVRILFATDPATTYLPSGVTYVLCTAPFTGMLLMFFIVAVSITSTAPGATAMPTKTRLPSFEIEMLLGWPLRGAFAISLPVLVSVAQSVR